MHSHLVHLRIMHMNKEVKFDEKPFLKIECKTTEKDMMKGIMKWPKKRHITIIN